MKEGTKTILLWCIAAAFVVGAAYALYRIEAAYAGTVQMNWAIWLGGFIGGIGASLFDGKKRNPLIKWSRKKSVISYLILVALIALLFYRSRDMVRMRIFPYQMLALILPSVWMDARIEKGADRKRAMGWYGIIGAVLLVVVSFGAPKVLGYVMIAEAAEDLSAQGYENVVFAREMRGNWLFHETEDTSFYEEGMEAQWFYLFRGEKAGEDWVVVLDPAGGESIFAASAEKEPMLAE